MFRKHPHEVEFPESKDAGFTDPSVPSVACCCPARPAVKVIMPLGSGREYPVDLWLCGHHYRDSLAVLLAAGAAIEDLTGTGMQPQAGRAVAHA